MKYNIDGMPANMPLEEWLWLTGQQVKKVNLEDEDAVASYYNGKFNGKELP